MTERLLQRDSYLKTFDARVTAVRPEGVRLDRTAFFPTGGGVLGDTGTLTGPSGLSRVVETMEDEGGVLHRLERAGLAVDDAVQRSGEHTSEIQSRLHLVCRLLLLKKKKTHKR